MSANSFAQWANAERAGVINLPADELLLRGIDHRLRRRKVRLADLHVNDVAARRFQRTSVCRDFHDMERFDMGEAI